MYDKKIILDTCALLWLVSGDNKISNSTRDSIEHASIVYVSAISAWEISLKVERGALELPLDTFEWFNSALKCHNLTLAPLNILILTKANKLPWHHKDPADRFIITTAIIEKATIVTADNLFKKYDINVII